jgi:hypothetical protein
MGTVCVAKDKTVVALGQVGESVRNSGLENDCFVGADAKEEQNFEVWEEELFIK